MLGRYTAKWLRAGKGDVPVVDQNFNMYHEEKTLSVNVLQLRRSLGDEVCKAGV